MSKKNWGMNPPGPDCGHTFPVTVRDPGGLLTDQIIPITSIVASVRVVCCREDKTVYFTVFMCFLPDTLLDAVSVFRDIVLVSVFPGYPDEITKFTTWFIGPGGGIAIMIWWISMTYSQFIIEHGFPISAVSTTFVFHTCVFNLSFNEVFLYLIGLVYKYSWQDKGEEYKVLLLINDI